MDYQVTKQLRSIGHTATLNPTEQFPQPVNIVINQDDDTLPVKRRDDEIVYDGVNPYWVNGVGILTVEEIDLRDFYNDGMVLDKLSIDIQRPIEVPIVNEMYNIDPTANIWETILITTARRPDTWSMGGLAPHLAGFTGVEVDGNIDSSGIAKPDDVVYAETRKYKHNRSLELSDATLYTQNRMQTDLLIIDGANRGYPDLIYAPTLFVWRIFSNFYTQRSPTYLLDSVIQSETAKVSVVYPPVQVTVAGKMRKGTESERIMEAISALPEQPARPGGSR
jgi:hypothetical protein